MKLRYIGPHDAVDITSADITVARREPFEATGDLAADLLRQPENFERVPAPKNRKPNKTEEA